VHWLIMPWIAQQRLGAPWLIVARIVQLARQ
jgi:hypothetical protein